jgi:hypothetical protein
MVVVFSIFPSLSFFFNSRGVGGGGFGADAGFHFSLPLPRGHGSSLCSGKRQNTLNWTRTEVSHCISLVCGVQKKLILEPTSVGCV